MQKLKIPRYIQWLILTGIFFLLLMTCLRIALVFAFKTSDSLSQLSQLSPSFLLGARFDLRIVAILCFVLFVIGSLKWLHPFETSRGKKIAFSVLIVFSIIFSFFYVFDFAHFAYLSQRLNGSALNYLEDAKISTAMVWQTYPVIRILLALVLSVFFFVWIVKKLYNHVVTQNSAATTGSKVVWGIAFFVVLAIGIFGRVGQFPLRWSDAFSLGNDYQSQVALNPFQSFFSSLSYRHSTYDIDKVKRHYSLMANYLGVTHPDSTTLNFERIITGDTIRNQPNIVLVICESFSVYKSSMISNPLNTTPFFKQMAASGIYFENCFSPSYGTARGVWATITGISDVQLYKTASRNPAAVDQHTIINDFAGYEKFYFLGGSSSWANIRGVLTNNISGLHMYEEGDYKAAKIDVWGISDKNLFLEANKVLGTQTKPFFAIIQTADNHRPYTIPEEDLKVFRKQNVPPDSLKKYGFTSLDEYNAFRYTDFTFKTFMKAAAKQPYYNNTIFVFVGDHGITGDAGEMLPKTFTEQRLTSEHVPLLIYQPKLVKPRTVKTVASQVDVLPTIAGLTGITYINNTLGKNLLANDSASVHAAFIFDPDTRKIGIIKNDIHYNYGMNSKTEYFGSITNNEPVKLNDAQKFELRQMAEAYYETARYMLLNNKKKR